MNKHQAIRAATEQIRTKQEKNNWFILKWDNTKKEFEKIQIIDKRASVWLAGYLRVELVMKLLGFPLLISHRLLFATATTKSMDGCGRNIFLENKLAITKNSIYL